jgi:hypothetical protein
MGEAAASPHQFKVGRRCCAALTLSLSGWNGRLARCGRQLAAHPFFSEKRLPVLHEQEITGREVISIIAKHAVYPLKTTGWQLLLNNCAWPAKPKS